MIVTGTAVSPGFTTRRWTTLVRPGVIGTGSVGTETAMDRPSVGDGDGSAAAARAPPRASATKSVSVVEARATAARASTSVRRDLMVPSPIYV